MKTNANSKMVIVSVLVLLSLCGSAWGVESSESIQGLISHWKFDEGSGTTAYDSAGGNDGTVYGVVWTTGQIDGALSFSGGDDYVDCGNSFASITGSATKTITAWAKSDVSDRSGRIITLYRRSDSYSAFVIYPRENDGGNPATWKGLYATPGNSHKLIDSEVSVTAGEWTHIALVQDGTNVHIYVDGELKNSVSGAAAPVISNPPHAVIGTYMWYGHGPSASFLGTIDDVRIYNRALSASEVRQLYGIELIGLEIVGPNEVAENFSASYKAIAFYDDNSTRDVTNLAVWAAEPDTAANIDGNGILTTKDIVTHQSATILASYTEGDVTVEAEKAINIFPICPIGTALQFDGVDDYVDCGNGSSLDLGFGSFTLAAWVKTSVTNQLNDRIVSHYCGGHPGHYQTVFIAFDGNRHAQVCVRDNALNLAKVIGTTNIEDGNWHCVVGVRDGDTLYLYVDGVCEGMPADASAVGDVVGPEPWTIGAAKDYRGILYTYYTGLIDEVSIYERALSIEEIWANMHRRLAGDEPGLVGYWDFDEGGGQVVYDLSGNGNDGQLGSTPDIDGSDPVWTDSIPPVGICTLYQIATMAAERALGRKLALLEELPAALAEEWTAYEALEEWLESGDYGDLSKGDIVTAKQKIHSAIQHEEQSIDALEKSIEKLKDTLSVLEPPILNQPPNVTITKPQDGAEFTASETIEIEANAWDVDGSVAKVEFFADGSKIGEDNDGTDGWKNNWYDHPVGTYSLTAKATDNDGAATTSPVVEIMVVEVPPPGQASNPNPANGATGVDRNTNLSWTAGSNAVSHNVYFGTTSPGTFQGNQTVATFDPSSMATYTTYYWRIDEVNPSGTTTGTVWIFRTGGGGPPI